MTVIFSTKLPCIICLKKLWFCFPIKKKQPTNQTNNKPLWNCDTVCFKFFYSGKNPYFASPEWVPVNIWSILALKLNFSIWLWLQVNNFATCEQYIYKYIVVCCHTLYQPQKPLIFFPFTFHFCVPCPWPQCACRATLWRLQQLLCVHITKSRAPIDVLGIWCGIPAEDAQEER